MKVTSYMRINPPTVQTGQPFRTVVEIFIQNKTDSVLVVDEQGQLAGIISHAHAFKKLGESVSQDTPVEKVMEKHIITIHPDVSVDKLIEWNVSSLPVVEDNRVLGLVTLSDTINAYNASMVELQRELTAVINGVYNGIISIDAKKRIRVINAAAEEYFRVKKEEVTGKSVYEILGEDFLPKVVDTGMPVVNKRVTVGEQIFIATCSCIRDKKGEISGAVGIFQNPTELESIYRELLHTKEMTEELNAIIESSFDGILVTDRNGMIRKCNTAFKAIVQERQTDLMGKSICCLTQKINLEFICHMKNTKTTITESCMTKDGAALLVSANPILDANGEVEGVVANVRDISNLRLLEEKVQGLNRLYKEQIARVEVSTKYVFESPASRKLLDRVMQIAKVDSTVLIMGESGVGKEIVAKMIYSNSDRDGRPFVKINCGAIPENLLESELFGYEEGAFTGAQKNGKQGLFEIAEGGVLLLDEVGDLPMHLQVKLLRVLQEREIIRIGGVTSKKIDVRIIAATNRDMKKMVEAGEYRADLYYRLNVVPVCVPALRERREDLLSIIQFYMQRINKKYHMQKSFTRAAIDEMYAYSWPGNIRELENIVERAVVTSSENVISGIGLAGQSLQASGAGWQGPLPEVDGNYKAIVDEFERRLLTEALNKFCSTRKAGSALGLDQSTVVKKAAKLGIKIK